MLKTEKQSWFSRTLGNIAPVKLLAGLAVGAMLVTVIGLPTTGVSADEPSRPLGPGYYFELDVADGGSPGRDSLREIQGYGSVEDMNIAAQLQNRSAKLSPVGYGPAADIPSLPKLELKGYGPLADVISTPKAAQRGFGAYIDMTYAPKVSRLDISVLSNGLDVPINNTSAKSEHQGFGSLDDLAAPRKVENRKVEHQGFGSLDDVISTPKVEQRGFGAIHDMTYAPKVEQRGFGSLGDVGAVQR